MNTGFNFPSNMLAIIYSLDNLRSVFVLFCFTTEFKCIRVEESAGDFTFNTRDEAHTW